MHIIVLFNDGQHVSIETATEDSARAAVAAAHEAMNTRLAFKIGDSATFRSEQVKSVYISKYETPPLPREAERSIFDAVFGRHR